MKKLIVKGLTFAPVAGLLLGVPSASADYPPSGGTGSVPSLPETGASAVHDATSFGGWTIFVGASLVAVIAIRRRVVRTRSL